MSADLEVQGFEELEARINDMGNKGSKIFNSALIKAAAPVLADAKNTRAFKDESGDLRACLKMSKIKNSKGDKYVWVGDIDRKVFYSWYVEYKTPFLRPALEKNKKSVFEIIKYELAEGLK